MQLLSNFNGWQASHSSCQAVAYHIKIGNVQIGNAQIGNIQIGNDKIGNAVIGRMEWPFSATIGMT